MPTRKKSKMIPKYPEIDIKATGDNIRNLRERSGVSIEIFSRYLNLSSSRGVYYWLCGKSLPSVDNLYAMSRLFEVTINDILVEKVDSQECEEQLHLCGGGMCDRMSLSKRNHTKGSERT